MGNRSECVGMRIVNNSNPSWYLPFDFKFGSCPVLVIVFLFIIIPSPQSAMTSCSEIRTFFETECLEDYYLMVITLVETKNSVVRKSEKSSQCKHSRELHLFDEDDNCCLICKRYEGLL